jgi:butyryl-CoA dehydrogenase
VQVFLEDVRVPAADLLGEPGAGFKYALQVLNGGRVGIATQAVGIAQGALDACLEALDARRRDEKPVRRTQDEDFRLAEIATDIEAARLLTWRAAWMRDRGVEHIREASMAKLFASEACDRACQTAVALLGPTGWLASGRVERFFRDARVTELYEGTTEVQKIVISRRLGV